MKMKEVIEQVKKQLRGALLSGDWNQAVAYVRVAFAILESTEAEQTNWEKCQYCGASRVVRPSGEWQFTCHCDEPEKRPKAEQPAVAEPGEFTKAIRGWIELLDDSIAAEEDATMLECWLVHPSDDVDCEQCPNMKDCREVRAEVDAQQEQIEKLKTEKGIPLAVLDQIVRQQEELDRLTADLKAKDERIAELERLRK